MAVNGGKTLTPRQEKAVVALLTERTIAAAAESAGVSTRSLERWLSEDLEFIHEYRAARRRVVEGAIGRLQEATTEAVDCLRRNLECGASGSEVRAATSILDRAISGLELYDLEARIAALEAQEEAREGV